MQRGRALILMAAASLVLAACRVDTTLVVRMQPSGAGEVAVRVHLDRAALAARIPVAESVHFSGISSRTSCAAPFSSTPVTNVAAFTRVTVGNTEWCAVNTMPRRPRPDSRGMTSGVT